jgi:drug/metabolite transporter (DMT)-like permease
MARGVSIVARVSRQAIGNAVAGVLFLIVAIVDFTRDSSGIGVVFVVFAAVFLGLASSARKAASPEKE